MSVEEWRPVTGYEGLYEVSDRGRVRSLDRTIALSGRGNGGTYLKTGRVLRHVINTSGHHQVMLCGHGRQRLSQVHRLVAAAFIGVCPPGLLVLHGDDNPNNNELANLRYGTFSDNQRDRYRIARQRRTMECNA